MWEKNNSKITLQNVGNVLQNINVIQNIIRISKKDD